MQSAPMRCVIVDDHAVFRLGLRYALEARGHSVIAEYADGRAAREALGTLEGVDLLIIDARMPEMSGFELARHVRGTTTTLPIAMVTTFDDEVARVRAVEAGVDDVVSKDETPEALVARLEQVAWSRPIPASYGSLLGLTHRELEVLELIVTGASNRAIGRALGVSVETVKDHVRQVYRKLGVSERASAVRVAIEQKLVSP